MDIKRIYRLEFKEYLDSKFIEDKIKVSYLSDFSITNTEMSIIVDQTKTAYVINNNKISIFQFILKNNSPSTFAIKPKSFLFNNYIHFDYMSDNTPYIYIYNIKENIGENIKISEDKNGNKASGIFDDILNTGFVNLRNTNKKELAYFTKRKYDLPEIFNENDDSNSVFIVKF